MLVPVQVEGAAKEWSIVEFQGQLISDVDMKGVDIGKLTFPNGVPTLRIGKHILAGKLAKLSKPMAIMEKHTNADDDDEAVPNGVSYEVVGIARSRIIFSTRPKPILTG
ncbi:TPA: hypothetical protein N0F65_008604 [Lagenidium giganteum]|uniref:Chromosome transmission fidelity protein 8 n=1 Tax=Lagenidium giganteum TaxID=4803 RepID=A0AAV2Z2Z5_9STRA|nr:TPA: hypothetical protein N0F65_008604 [Lagenidium giganteum]